MSVKPAGESCALEQNLHYKRTTTKMKKNKYKTATGIIRGAILTIVGLTTTIATKALGAEGFWHIYTIGFMVTGITTMGIGLLITTFSILKSYTALLDLEQKIDANKLGLVLAVSIIAVIVINVLVLPKLPNKPDKELIRQPPQVAKIIRAKENNFRVFFSFSIIIAGIAISAIPSIKFFKN